MWLYGGASADQIFVDVIDNTSQTRASKLAEEIEGLPAKEQRRILNVVETMVRDAKEMQDEWCESKREVNVLGTVVPNKQYFEQIKND